MARARTDVPTRTKWVKLNRYCELSGDTPNAVHAKRKRGLWLDGVHCRIAPDGKLWVNVDEVERWVENGIVMDEAL